MRDERHTAEGVAAHFGDIKTTAAVSAVTVIVAMPAFLVAASGALVRVDLGFDQAGLGLAISTFFGASAGASVVGGRWSERLGAGRALVLTTAGSGGVLVALATIPKSFTHLVVLLAVGGALNGAAQPAASLALARGALDRPGLMFGVKQSAVPVTSLVAGASVPLLGVALGWRAAFVVAALLAVAVAAAVPWRLAPPSERIRSQTTRREGDAGTAPLVTLSIAAGVATAAAFTLPAFLVESAVDNGISLSNAGWMLVAASSASIGGRLAAGWWVDRGRAALYLVSVMLVTGAGGFAMLALGGPVLFLLGALVAYAFGWGWTGVLMYAIVRLNPNAPALATGIVLTGLATGAAVGPFAFGIAVKSWGFDAAWALAGGASVASAGLLVAARLWVLLDRRRRQRASS